MSKGKAEILNKLREMSRQDPVIVPARVVSVNESDATCRIEINELTFKARLNAAENSNKGFLILPSTGSWVLAGRMDESGDTWSILAFTEVDKVIMREGSNGGIAISSSIVDKLNALEQDLNVIKQAFTTWTPVSQDGGAALKLAAASWSSQPLTPTVIQNIEDTQVLH